MANFTPVGVELVVKGANQFFGTLDQAGSKVASVGATIGKAAVAGVAALGTAVVGVGVASLKAAIDFETAFAGVIKTTDGLVDEFGNLTESGEKMEKGFRDLAKEIPTSVEELLAIGELGGQLGIAEDQLVGFTKTIAAMGEATNLSTEEAATGFAQLANIMGTPQEEIENMGSSVVALGNSFATTERDVLNFASRIAGAGQVAGLTEAQVFGIGAAFSSVGIQAQAGGTATSKALIEMNKAALEGGEKMEIFAAVAGISADEFGKKWDEDAGAVFAEFVKGLGIAGDDAIGILDALEIKDSQAVRAFLSLAGAGDLVSEAMGTATDAFEDNTALTKEAEARYKTTASQFKIFGNQIKDVAITIGQALLPFLNDLLKAAKPLIAEFGKRVPGAMEKVIRAVKKVISVIKGLVESIVTVFTQGELLDPSEFIPGFFELPDAVQDIIERLQFFFVGLIDFLAIAIPQAAQTASSFFVNVLQPAIATVWDFVQNVAIPIAQRLVAWLSINIPVALQMLSEFWTGTLQPAIQTVASFIQTTLLPTFQSIVNFLVVNLLPVVQATSGFMIEQFQKIVSWVQANWPLIQETVATVVQFISDLIQSALATIRTFWEENGQAIIETVNSTWEIIQTIIDTATTILTGIIEAAMLVINGSWDEAWALLRETVKTVTTAINNIVKIALQALATIVPVLMEIVKAAMAAAWEAIKVGVAIAWEAIKRIVNSALLLLKAVIVSLMEVIKTAIVEAWESVKTAIFIKWEEIKRIIRNALSLIPGIVAQVADRLLAAGKAIVENIKQGISSAWDDLVGWFEDKLSDLASLLPFSEAKKGPLKGLVKAGIAIVKNIIKGMQKQFNAVKTQMTSIGDLVDAELGKIAANVQTKMDEITQTVIGALDTMNAAVMGGLETIKATFDAVWAEVRDTTASRFDEIRAAVQAGVSSLGNVDFSAARNIGNQIVNEIKGGVDGGDWGGVQAAINAQVANLTVSGMGLAGPRSIGKKIIDGIIVKLKADWHLVQSALNLLVAGLTVNTPTPTPPSEEEECDPTKEICELSAPIAAPRTVGGAVPSTTTVSINFGGVTITSDMDLAVFETRVLEVVRDAVAA